MSFKQYLGAFLLGAAAYLYSPVLQAEDIQQKVMFKDSKFQAGFTPGRDLEGTLNVSATRDKNKLVLEVSAEKCEIKTENSEFCLCLPVEPEIIEMKQTARVDERTQDGRGYEVKWIDLMPNEAFEKTSIRLATWLVGQVPIPFLSEAMDKVQDNKRTREEELARKMKKKSLVIMKLSPHYPKMPGAYPTTIARKYEMTLDMEPDKTPEAYLQVCLEDPDKRTVIINGISVKFDGKSQKPQTTRVPKSDLEKFLLEDILNSGARLHTFENKNCKFTLQEFYDPGELSKALGIPVKNSYLVKYHYQLPRPDGTYETDFYLALVDSNTDKNLVSNKYTNIWEEIDSKHSLMRTNLEWPGKSILPKNIDTEDDKFKEMDFKNVTHLHMIYGSIARCLQTRSRTNPLFMYIEY
jgi:hypothetical protein